MSTNKKKCHLWQKLGWVWFALKKYFQKIFARKKSKTVPELSSPNLNRESISDFIIENASDINFLSYYLFYNNLSDVAYELMETLQLELQKYPVWRHFLSLDKNDFHSYYKYTSDNLTRNVIAKSGGRLTIKPYQGEPLQENDAILMFPGIGDELSACVLFSMIKSQKLNVYCDHRLKSIIEHTFDWIHVHPTWRLNPFSTRLDEILFNSQRFCTLPNFTLAKFMDGNTLHQLENHEKVYSVFDLLAKYWTKDNYKKITYFKSTKKSPLHGLPKEKKKVGIIWKSLSRKGERDMFSIPEEALRTILEQGDALFVNLQYRSTATHEKMLNPDIDKVNDIDGLSALISELDLVIGPATATVRVAAMSGTPTIIYSAGLFSKFFMHEDNMDKRLPLTYHVPCSNVSDVEQATQEIIDIINGREIIDFS